MMTPEEIKQHAIETADGINKIVRNSGLSVNLKGIVAMTMKVIGKVFIAAESRRDWDVISTIEKGFKFFFKRWHEVETDVKAMCKKLDENESFNPFGTLLPPPPKNRNRLSDLGLDDLLGDDPSGLN